MDEKNAAPSYDFLTLDDIRFHEHGSDKLMIWFGGINEPHFNPEVARLADCDFLTFRDQRNMWYMAGFSPQHESFGQAATELEAFVNSRGYRKLCFCGQSSGGYGALLYANLLQADLCIAFSPQTRNLFSGQCQMAPHIKILDLNKIYQDNKKTKIIFNMSRSESDHEDQFSWDDWRQIEKLKEHPNSTVIIHPYHNHSISVKLREAGLLYNLTASLVKTYLG